MKATIGITLALLTLIVGVALATPLELRSPIEWRSVVAADAEPTMGLELPIPAVDDPTLSSSHSDNIAPHVVTYQRAQVMWWAYAASADGALLESEADAVVRNIDPKDEDACCSARLSQKVLRKLALGRRMEDAYSAAQRYDQLVASIEATPIIETAMRLQDQLMKMAEQAERLEIPDGDLLQLRQQHWDLVDQAAQQKYAGAKARQDLARLTDRPESEVAVAVLVDPLPRMIPNHDGNGVSAAAAVERALSQRYDLHAAYELCRGLRRCNLPAARQLIGILSPGAGLSFGTVVTGKLLSCLKDDHSDDDLAARKRQCYQLQESLRSAIRNETLQAVLDLRLASERLRVIEQQLGLAEERASLAAGRVKLDRATPGSDLLLDLEVTALMGNQLERQLRLAITIHELHESEGRPLPSVE
ncbi:MAG: hypothetical protein AAGD07_18230 [Planctomycetota bacterium]